MARKEKTMREKLKELLYLCIIVFILTGFTLFDALKELPHTERRTATVTHVYRDPSATHSTMRYKIYVTSGATETLWKTTQDGDAYQVGDIVTVSYTAGGSADSIAGNPLRLLANIAFVVGTGIGIVLIVKQLLASR